MSDPARPGPRDVRRLGRWAAAALLLLAGIALWFALRARPVGPESALSPEAGERGPPAGAEPPRVHIPRRTPRPAASRLRRDRTSPPTAPPSDPPVEDEQVPRGPIDRREDAPADGAPDLREMLTEQMDEVRVAVLPCVQRWAAIDPGLDGALTLRFGLDADGLQDVWIEDQEAVPEPMLDCFADAVYLGDWSGITPDPLEVSWPFEVTAD